MIIATMNGRLDQVLEDKNELESFYEFVLTRAFLAGQFWLGFPIVDEQGNRNWTVLFVLTFPTKNPRSWIFCIKGTIVGILYENKF